MTQPPEIYHRGEDDQEHFGEAEIEYGVDIEISEWEYGALYVGAQVHYVPAEGQCRAAVVTRIWSTADDGSTGVVNLNVHNDQDRDPDRDETRPLYPVTSVPFSKELLPKTWHWEEFDLE